MHHVNVPKTSTMYVTQRFHVVAVERQLDIAFVHGKMVVSLEVSFEGALSLTWQ
jgi:hypothetical protein